MKNYRCEDLGEKFYGIIKKVANVQEEHVDKISLDDIASLEKNLNINKIPITVVEEEDTPPDTPKPNTPQAEPVVPVKVKSHESRKLDIKDRLKKKLEDKKKKMDVSELIKLKKQLDTLSKSNV